VHAARFALAAAALALSSTSALAADTPALSGQWTVHNSVAGNESDQPCTFEQKDTALTGTCKGMDGKDIPVTGSFDGKKVTWKYEMDFNGSTLTLTYTATVEDPKKIAGSVDVQPFNMTGAFTATPAAAAAAPAAAAAGAASAPAPAPAVSGLTGAYTVHNSVGGNESDQPCSFEQKDAVITGTCKGMDGKDIPIAGSLDGKKLTYKYDMDFNGTTLNLTYTATVDDVKKFTGSVDVQPFNVTGEFTAATANGTAK